MSGPSRVRISNVWLGVWALAGKGSNHLEEWVSETWALAGKGFSRDERLEFGDGTGLLPQLVNCSYRSLE